MELLELLAGLEHDRWSRWQQYLHSQCIKNKDGSLTIPKEKVDRWERQIATDYSELSEDEKESDRKEARKALKLIKDMKILRESIINEHDWKQADDDSRNAQIQLKSIRDAVTSLIENIKEGDKLDAWVLIKIAQAEESLHAVQKYVMYETEEDIDDLAIDTPEIVTDTPPADVAPESPVPLSTPDMDLDIDAEDELEMDDLVGPGPDVADEFDWEDSRNGAMEPAEDIPLDVEDEVEDEEMEEKFQVPMVEYDDDDDDMMMESLDSFLEK